MEFGRIPFCGEAGERSERQFNYTHKGHTGTDYHRYKAGNKTCSSYPVSCSASWFKSCIGDIILDSNCYKYMHQPIAFPPPQMGEMDVTPPITCVGPIIQNPLTVRPHTIVNCVITWYSICNIHFWIWPFALGASGGGGIGGNTQVSVQSVFTRTLNLWKKNPKT